MNSNAKIGLFGTGLDTYWGQFDGLLDELKGYQARIRDRMERDAGVQVADAGMVDSPARALEAASLFAPEQVDRRIPAQTPAAAIHSPICRQATGSSSHPVTKAHRRWLRASTLAISGAEQAWQFASHMPVIRPRSPRALSRS